MNTDNKQTSKRRRMWWIPVFIIAGLIGVMAMRSWSAKRPDTLGIQNGELLTCPGSPNCVCTFDTDQEHGLPPIPMTVEPVIAMQKIKTILKTWPRTKIITDTENYLHAESASALFHFVDDVEIFIDAEKRLIHVRSESRVGHSDLGVNRQRMEKFKAAYLAAEAS